MTGQPPRPAPPSRAFLVSRALTREHRLTDAERAARNSVAPPRPHGETPGERIARFGPVLVAAGWRVTADVHPLRARLEGFHPSGAVVMFTSDVRSTKQGKVRAYFLRPPGIGWWRRLRIGDVDHFAAHVTLPAGAPDHPVVGGSKCRCGKVQHPTAARAAAALEDVTAVRAAEENGRAPEARYYRCESDDRVWHLTSKPTGYTRSVPLAGAFPRPRPRTGTEAVPERPER
ncbi:hypothetical protein ACFVU3_11905 [Streptomyces sp. NPDC058052]|uniref:hypothetical protein n=1 Tax=Streptomyces sp. NPDC058052 TaxID=3346316 RepID=UPI0036EDA606